MPTLPSLKPLFQSAYAAYEKIRKPTDESLVKQSVKFVGSYMRFKDTSNDKKIALKNLADFEAKGSAEEQKQALSAIFEDLRKHLGEGGHFDALFQILDSCYKLSSEVQSSSLVEALFALQPQLIFLYSCLDPKDPANTFYEYLRTYFREMEAYDRALRAEPPVALAGSPLPNEQIPAPAASEEAKLVVSVSELETTEAVEDTYLAVDLSPTAQVVTTSSQSDSQTAEASNNSVASSVEMLDPSATPGTQPVVPKSSDTESDTESVESKEEGGREENEEATGLEAATDQSETDETRPEDQAAETAEDEEAKIESVNSTHDPLNESKESTPTPPLAPPKQPLTVSASASNPNRTNKKASGGASNVGFLGRFRRGSRSAAERSAKSENSSPPLPPRPAPGLKKSASKSD